MTLKHRYFGIFVSELGWRHLTGDRGVVPLGLLFQILLGGTTLVTELLQMQDFFGGTAL